MANKFDIDRIPSLSKVKKQKRLVSRDLHPDRVGSERVEELKQFLNMNKELEDYLIEHELFADDETNELFEDEDHLSMEEIERIVKKGIKVRDHDHWSGEFRGAAHNLCNITQKSEKDTCVFSQPHRV